jgi:RimJ/RimL family protein N-acetyltransferase
MHRIEWKVPMAEIGYWVRTAHSGNGYMTEAVEAVTALATDGLMMQRVEIRCDVKNRRSAAVAERAGYTLEGVLHKASRDHRDQLRDTCVYAKVL